VLHSLCHVLFATSRHPPNLASLSLPDALPICRADAGGARGPLRGRGLHRGGTPAAQPLAGAGGAVAAGGAATAPPAPARGCAAGDRKSTRLNSSHVSISYAVFCLKKKRSESWI